MLSENENKILQLLKEDPFMSQKDIGDKLGLNRSTVATIISNLISKKKIQGRAYIINDYSQVICIGAMNIDRKYTLEHPLIMGTSNPVLSSMGVGGVARNVAENLGRLAMNVALISMCGDDSDASWIFDQTQRYVGLNYVDKQSESSTGSYSAILDKEGEMLLALADMSIYDKMTQEWIETYEQVLVNAEVMVLDLNVTKEVAAYIINLADKHQIPLFVIPVSAPKMAHLPKEIQGVYYMIVNRDESEAYFEVEPNQISTQKLAQMWIEKGVDHVLVTAGTHETIYMNQNGSFKEYRPPLSDKVVDVTGAGDSYAAAIVYGHLQGLSEDAAIKLAMTNAYYTVQSHETVRKELSPIKLTEESQNLFKE